MKEEKIKLSYSCKKDWENMNEVDGGRFCNACKKNVIDFTCMSIPEIRASLSQKSGRVCGRFTSEQAVSKKPWVHAQLIQLNLKIERNIRPGILKFSLCFLVIVCMTLVGCNGKDTRIDHTLGVIPLDSANINKIDSLDGSSINATEETVPKKNIHTKNQK